MKTPDANTIIDAVCMTIAIVFIACMAAGFYSCPGCSREEFVKQQAAQLDARAEVEVEVENGSQSLIGEEVAK